MVEYSEAYKLKIKEWEDSGELTSFLTHLRPKYLNCNYFNEKQETLHYMILYMDQTVGTIWLEDIKNYEARLGIYIANSNCRGLGIGKLSIKKLLEIAKTKYRIKTVNLRVRENNLRAYNCYLSCGFEEINRLPKQLFTDGSYQGVIEMRLIL